MHGNADGLSRLTWDSATLADQDEDAVLIHSVNIELLSSESIKAILKQDPVLSQVVDWLKASERPVRRYVAGGGCKLLSHWSQWGRLFLKDGLVLRRKNEMIGQEIYQQICLPESLVPQVLFVLHNSPSAGHLGVSKTLEKVLRRLFLAWHM